jgi:hypothetical protein
LGTVVLVFKNNTKDVSCLLIQDNQKFRVKLETNISQVVSAQHFNSIELRAKNHAAGIQTSSVGLGIQMLWINSQSY